MPARDWSQLSWRGGSRLQRRCPPSKWRRARVAGMPFGSAPVVPGSIAHRTPCWRLRRRSGCRVARAAVTDAVVGAALDVPSIRPRDVDGRPARRGDGCRRRGDRAPSLSLLSGATWRAAPGRARRSRSAPVEVVADGDQAPAPTSARASSAPWLPPDGRTRSGCTSGASGGRAGDAVECRPPRRPEPHRAGAVGTIHAARHRHRWRLDRGQHRPRRRRCAPRRGRPDVERQEGEPAPRSRRARSRSFPRTCPARPSQPADGRHLPAVRGSRRSRRATRRGGPADPGAAHG